METEAIFDNVEFRVLQEIEKASNAIFIVTNHFNNKNLFEALISKAKNGCRVLLIFFTDESAPKLDINYNRLNTEKSKIYFIRNQKLLHSDFSIIDYETIISGPSKWSSNKESNTNLIITKDNVSLTNQFINQFNDILQRYIPHESIQAQVLPLDKIIKRLEIIKNYIQLGDMEDVSRANDRLSEYGFNKDILAITVAIKEKAYSSAISLIEFFINKHSQISVWIDPKVAALKLEIKNLENQLNAVDNEKTELEKIIANFQHRYTIELGDIILEILTLRKQKFKNEKNEEKFREAEEDEKEYRKQVNIEKEKHVFELTKEGRAELKKKFREASHMCHPDKVSDKLKEVAEQIFINLKNAYEANDLERVSIILAELKEGKFLKSKSETITEKEHLEIAISKLKHQIEQLRTQILSIKENETYQEIQQIEDWDDYFSDLKNQLLFELENLRNEVIIE